MMDTKLISICIPVLNEEKNILLAYERILKVFESLEKYQFEIIFTDNASCDGTYKEIIKLNEQNKKVKVVRFSRNIGYQKSIWIGNLLAKGDAIIQLDCDMQDPPELIGKMIKKWEQGYDVVYGIRKERNENWFMNTTRKIFYRVLNFISDEKLPIDVGDFRLIDKKIIKVLSKIQDQSPYLRGTIAKIGFHQVGIEYSRNERRLGKTKFNFKNLISLALDAVISNSTFPLKLSTYIGFVLSVVCIFWSSWYLYSKVFLDANWPSGFTTIVMLSLFNLAFSSLMFGVLGAYIMSITKQVKLMPMAIISNKCGIQKSELSIENLVDVSIDEIN